MSDLQLIEGGLRQVAVPFDLVVSKLRVPLPRPGTVARSSLVELLAKSDAPPVVSVVAPAGYGKTSLLAQWAVQSDQAFAWVSVDDADNDPKVLLTYVAEALDAVESISERVFEALASMESSVSGVVVPRLASAFWSMSSRVVLVLDDVHLLHDNECRTAVSVLAEHVPEGSRLVLAGRDSPPLRVARLRAEGRILEIDAGDLALTVQEAAELLHSAEVTLDIDEVAALHQRTEGWATGLYLAALSIREGGAPATGASFDGTDVFVFEYVESEFLDRISASQREFLTRTAVLERMCGPLCQAVLEGSGAGVSLAELSQSNLLLVPLDHRGEWYRYHHLFRDILLAELERRELAIVPSLQRRAAAWCLDNGLPEEALEYSIAAADVDQAARLVEDHWLPVLMLGRDVTLQRWIQWLDGHDGVERHPMVAVAGGVSAGVMGRPEEADRWAEWVEHWQSQDAAQHSDPVTRAWATVIRAFFCRHGIEQMRADADEAAQVFLATGHDMGPLSALLQGIARVLSGDLDSGDACLKDSVAAGESFSGPHHPIAVAERALLAIACGQWDQAQSLADDALILLRVSGLEESSMAGPLVCAVQARVSLHMGDVAAARQQAVNAQRLRVWLNYSLPYIAVQARIQLTRVYLALADLPGARTLMREIDEILRLRPGLGTLVDEAEALRAQVAKGRGPTIPGPSALTAAELRLLPLLSTHLSYPELAKEMILSPSTIRSQGMAIYRKLGANSRNEAVARAREIGLLE